MDEFESGVYDFWIWEGSEPVKMQMEYVKETDTWYHMKDGVRGRCEQFGHVIEKHRDFRDLIAAQLSRANDRVAKIRTTLEELLDLRKKLNMALQLNEWPGSNQLEKKNGT